MKVTTNHVPRDIIDASQLTLKEQEEFDYLDWAALERGEDTASFFRYGGQVYDIGEFTTDYGILKGSGLPSELIGWDGYMTESAFSAIVVKYCNDYESVIVGVVLT